MDSALGKINVFLEGASSGCQRKVRKASEFCKVEAHVVKEVSEFVGQSIIVKVDEEVDNGEADSKSDDAVAVAIMVDQEGRISVLTD